LVRQILNLIQNGKAAKMKRTRFSNIEAISKRYRGAIWIVSGLAIMVVMFSLVSGNAQSSEIQDDSSKDVRANNSCSATTDAAFRACLNGAEDNYWITIGNCNNLSSASAREECKQEARATRLSERRDCDEQEDSREDVCESLGEAPYDPQINPAMFVDPTQIGMTIAPNPYFLLIPGRTMVYQGGSETVRVTVTGQTRQILGVTCATVHDVVRNNGVVVEDTTDWYGQDIFGNVWYFGEIAQTIEAGILVGIEGSWTAGVERAKPGFQMKIAPVVNEVYRQEFSLGTAEDLAQVLSRTGSATVPAASCNNTCLVTKEFSPIISGLLEDKYYAYGIGFILEVTPATGERLELVQVINN
jgi:hypothetical protein